MIISEDFTYYSISLLPLKKGVAAAKDHDIGTTNLHIEVSDVVNILVNVGIAKGNGIISKSGKINKLYQTKYMD